MTIKYWTDFSKRKNSTKQPTGGTQATVRLKEPCGIASPSFICNGIPDTVKYIEAFGRYYFVSEVTHDGAEIVIDCVSDPMATFKSSIGSLYADVEYTSSSTNTDITDPRNRPTYVSDTTETTIASIGSFGTSGPQFQAGYNYIMGVLSDEGINYYIMDNTDFSVFTSFVFDTNFANQIQNQFYDMKSCVVSCIAVPIVRNIGTQSPITIGGHTITHNGANYNFYKLTTRVFSKDSGATAISFPSDTWGFDYSYLDVSPYTSGSVYLPFVGVVDFDVELFAQNKSIQIKIYIDIVTGDIVYHFLRSGAIVSTYAGNFGAGVPIAGQSYNAIGAAQGMLATLGGVATMIGGAIAENPAVAVSGLGAAVGGAVGSMASMQRHTQINGSNSSMIGSWLGHDVKVFILSRRPAEMSIDSAYKAVSGMPYFKGATISSLSGFIKCNSASINISGFESDRETINGYLNSGFYYE